MPIFNIHFGHDHGFSERNIEAASLLDALKKAKTMEVNYADFVGQYECGLDVEYIRVLDEDGNEVCWDHPDCIRDHAAHDLLEAAEEFLNSVSTPGNDQICGEHPIDSLRRAVAKARGFCKLPVSRNAP
jgi:hypothetical protein